MNRQPLCFTRDNRRGRDTSLGNNKQNLRAFVEYIYDICDVLFSEKRMHAVVCAHQHVNSRTTYCLFRKENINMLHQVTIVAQKYFSGREGQIATTREPRLFLFWGLLDLKHIGHPAPPPPTPKLYTLCRRAHAD